MQLNNTLGFNRCSEGTFSAVLSRHRIHSSHINFSQCEILFSIISPPTYPRAVQENLRHYPPHEYRISTTPRISIQSSALAKKRTPLQQLERNLLLAATTSCPRHTCKAKDLSTKRLFFYSTFAQTTNSVEFFSVNGFIEWSANISGSIRGLLCIVSFFFFYCWLAFVSWKSMCLWLDWLESLEGGVVAPGVTCQNQP